MKNRSDSLTFTFKEVGIIFDNLPEGKAKNIIIGKIKSKNRLKGKWKQPIPTNITHKSKAEEFKAHLTKNATKAEKKFKKYLDDLDVEYEFQHIYYSDTSFFIIDFFLPKYSIAVEIDGGYHNTPQQKRKDAKRDKTIHYKILTYTNEQVLKNKDTVFDSLSSELKL